MDVNYDTLLSFIDLDEASRIILVPSGGADVIDDSSPLPQPSEWLGHRVAYSLTWGKPLLQDAYGDSEPTRKSFFLQEIEKLQKELSTKGKNICTYSSGAFLPQGKYFEAGLTIVSEIKESTTTSQIHPGPSDGSTTSVLKHILHLATSFGQKYIYRYRRFGCYDLSQECLQSLDGKVVSSVKVHSVRTNSLTCTLNFSVPYMLLQSHFAEVLSAEGESTALHETSLEWLSECAAMYKQGDCQKFPTKSVILLEGVDGAGKSTLGMSLASHLQEGIYLHVPPRENWSIIQTLCDYFDRCCSRLVRRCYYMLCNYWTVGKISALAKEGLPLPILTPIIPTTSPDHDIFENFAVRSTSTLILDRFFPSTVAYGVAEYRKLVREAVSANIPEEDSRRSSIVSWPWDLATTDVTIFLNIDEKERERRIRQRNGENITWEEKELSKSALQMLEVTETIMRLETPLVHIDAGCTATDLLHKALEIIQQKA